VLLCWHVAN
jgi:hypothetical protein